MRSIFPQYLILFPQGVNNFFKVMSSSDKIFLTLRTDLKNFFKCNSGLWDWNTRIESWDLQDPHRKWPFEQLKILPFFGNFSKQTFGYDKSFKMKWQIIFFTGHSGIFWSRLTFLADSSSCLILNSMVPGIRSRISLRSFSLENIQKKVFVTTNLN